MNMEKLPHEEYRDELADKLKDIRNSDPENPEIAKAKAEGYLEAKKETEEYHIQKDKHQQKIEKQRTLDILKKEFEIVDSALNKLKQSTDIGNIFTNIEFSLKPIKYGYGGEITDTDDYRISSGVGSDFYETKEELQKKDLEIMEQLHLVISHIDDILDDKEKKAISNKKLFSLYSTNSSNASTYYLEYNDEKKEWKIKKEDWIQSSGFISSLRFKEELQPIENTVEKVNKLRGVSFKWKSSEESPREIGVIAEEVAEVFPELVFLDQKGKPLGVHYDKFIAVLIEAIKELDKRVKELEK